MTSPSPHPGSRSGSGSDSGSDSSPLPRPRSLTPSRRTLAASLGLSLGAVAVAVTVASHPAEAGTQPPVTGTRPVADVAATAQLARKIEQGGTVAGTATAPTATAPTPGRTASAPPDVRRGTGFRPVRLPVQADDVAVAGINDRGTVVGSYTRGRITRGFVLDGGRFTSLALGSGSETRARGVGRNGDVVGSFTDRHGRTHGFWWVRGRASTIDVPGARSTVLTGIADRHLVGRYTSRDGRATSFVAALPKY